MACEEAVKSTDELEEEIIGLANDLFPDRVNGGKDVLLRIMGQVFEECGEVHGAIRDFYGRTHKPQQRGNKCDIVNEIGDALGGLIHILYLLDVPLNKCLTTVVTKFEKMKTEEAKRLEYVKYQEQFAKELEEGQTIRVVMSDGSETYVKKVSE
jgi:NTP pyrophosphatase (non-canonical NTP hydrolase)